MHRGQYYESWEAVKSELSPNVKHFKPAGCSENVNLVINLFLGLKI